MTVTTDAIVTFGVQVMEEETLPFPWPPPEHVWGKEQEECLDPSSLGEYLARCRGIECPYDDPSAELGHGSRDLGPARFRAWGDEVRKAQDGAPIEIVRHCCGDCVTSIVALKGTTVRAPKGRPAELELPEIDPRRIEAAAAFCAANRIHPFEEPRWLLCSYSGLEVIDNGG